MSVRTSAEYGLEDYDRAIELEPGYPFVHCSRASLLQKMGEFEKAIPDMLKCLALAPDLPGQFFQMAETLFVVGEFDKAERIYQKVLDHPRTPEKEKEMAQEGLQRIANMREIQEEFDEVSLKIRRSL